MSNTKSNTMCDILAARKAGSRLKVFKNAWFVRFVRKEKVPVASLWEAVDRANQGQVDADLGGGVIKQRIARSGGGKSGGFRSIVLFRKGHRAFFVFGFAKSELGNIRPDEEAQFKKMAKYVLALSDEQMERLIESGQFEEVTKDG